MWRRGLLILLEHGRAQDPGVVAWQDRFTHLRMRVGRGCRLNQEIGGLIQAAGFQITEVKMDYIQGRRPLTYTYEGFGQRGESMAQTELAANGVWK